MRLAIRIEHDVGWLHIAMHDAMSVGIRECLRDLGDDLRGPSRLRWPFFTWTASVVPRTNSSTRKGVPSLVWRSQNRDDARMSQASRAGLHAKAIDIIAYRPGSATQNLHGHWSIKFRVDRLEHLPSPARFARSTQTCQAASLPLGEVMRVPRPEQREISDARTASGIVHAESSRVGERKPSRRGSLT